MNCETVRARLPLWIEGDLAGSEARDLGEHLDRCAACHDAASALRESQAWLRGGAEPPFGPEDFPAFRAGVMAEVRREAAPHPVRRGYLVPLAAAAAAMAALALHHRPIPTMLSGPPGPALPKPPPPPPAAHKVAGGSPHPQQPARIAPAPPQPSAICRIEFQTADPSIRIIWLAQADAPTTDAVPSTH